MRKLPFAERAVVDDSKLNDYLLNSSHPDGASKALFFHQNGFDSHSGELLKDLLFNHAIVNPVKDITHSEYGTKYIIEGPVKTKKKRILQLRCIWIVNKHEDVARLITCYPI